MRLNRFPLNLFQALSPKDKLAFAYVNVIMSPMIDSFEPSVREVLKSYVYLYIDPRTGKPFYIGKGQGNRVFSHLRDETVCDKVSMITELRKLKLEPILEILKYNLTEDEAFLVESPAIDVIDVENLTNELHGHGSSHGTRGSVDDLAISLGSAPAEISEPAMLIRIARAFHYGMSAQALYDATRSAWKVGKRREKARYALAVYHGIVREVYKIVAWVDGGSTMRSSDKDGRHEIIPGRHEFVGQVAEEIVRNKYVGRRVDGYLVPGSQYPIRYVNCGADPEFQIGQQNAIETDEQA